MSSPVRVLVKRLRYTPINAVGSKSCAVSSSTSRAQARAEGLRHSALVSVQGSQPYWQRQGYALHPLPDAAQQARLASYGEGAVYMARTL